MPQIRKWLKPRRVLQQLIAPQNALITLSDKVSADIQTVDSHIDHNLLTLAFTHWQFGDWHKLAELSSRPLEHQPDRAKLALLIATGHYALGNTSDAREGLLQAMAWGCEQKLIRQMLVSGVYCTLGRAAAAADMAEEAAAHFCASIQIGISNHGDIALLAQSRTRQQFEQLGLPPPATKTAEADTAAFHPEQVAQIELGQAWAANTVNTVVFRYHGILTLQDYQYTAFYANEQTLRVAQRNLLTNEATTIDVPGNYNLRDAHNSISLGADRAGHLHMCYDHHATQLRYKRSLQPHDISVWTDELVMTGAHEERVTYPTFILPHHGYPLTLLYRDGIHNKGSARIKTYDEGKQAWTDHPVAILSGTDQKPWTSNAYWNHPAVGTDGALHLSFVWRIQGMGEAEVVNNVNICYAVSPDNGYTWFTLLGHPYKLPITQVNAETVWPIAPSSNLINQCSMALDSDNRPHIVFYANDTNGIPQYQHLWFNGKKWQLSIISNRLEPFQLAGGGTLQIPISRPVIVIDQADNVYTVYRGDITNDRLTATKLIPPEYEYKPTNSSVLNSNDLMFAEPVIDHSRWIRDNVLSNLTQTNDQPNHDIAHHIQYSGISIQDFKFFPGK